MLKGLIVLSAIMVSTPVWAAKLVKPNPELTYGTFCDKNDRDFVEFRYPEQVAYCYRHVSSWQKDRIYRAYGIPVRCRAQYTIDHFVPLALGGNNADANLWPEHRHVKATRQHLEQNLFTQLRNGTISHGEAVKQIMEAKMNPGRPEPWKCGVSDNLDISADKHQY